MTGLEVALTLLIVLIVFVISSAIIFVQWWRRKFRQEHSDVGSVTGNSTHSAASKEMMYFMCWENSSQVAALEVPVSPASTNKEMPPAMITPHKEPPAFVGLDMHRAPRPSPLPPSPPVIPMRLPVQERMDQPRASPQAPAREVDQYKPAPSPSGCNVLYKVYPDDNGTPLPRSPPVIPMRLPVQERMGQPRANPQAPAREVDQYKPAPSPSGCNVLYKVYPDENGTLFANKDVLNDGERKRSSATKITDGSVFRQPSSELDSTTPAQSPPFYTPVSSPLRTTEGELSNLYTPTFLPSSKDAVERFYPKKVKFKDTPDHVKSMVG